MILRSILQDHVNSEMFINSILVSLIAIRYLYSNYKSRLRNIPEERRSPSFTCIVLT